jgi:outer membrane lipoprotein-sorting protein
MTICFLLTIAAFGYSQSDPAAKAILDDMKSEYDSYKSVEIEFTLEIELPEQAMETQKGKIIQRKEKYAVSLDDQAIYCDGETVWVHLKDNKEVQINDYEEDTGGDIMSPKDILSVYESGEYEYVLVNEQREDGAKIQQIEFKPLDRDSEYSKMRLTLVKGSKQLKRVKIFAKDGSRFTMKVDKLKSNSDYLDSTFKFNADDYPGIYVEDLRL